MFNGQPGILDRLESTWFVNDQKLASLVERKGQVSNLISWRSSSPREHRASRWISILHA